LAQIPALQATPVGQFNKKDRHAALGLARYLSRMAAKTSPFSRFTTVGVASTDDDDTPAFLRAARSSKVVPNVAVLELLYDALLRQPVVQRALPLRLNPSVTAPSTEGYRWWYFDGADEAVQVNPHQPTVHFVVTWLFERGRQAPFADLQVALSEALDGSADAAQVAAYLHQLVAWGLLEWVLPEPGTTPSWAGNLYQWLGFLPEGSRHEAVTDAAFVLQWLRTAARTLPFQPVEEAAQTQRAAVEQVRQYLARFDFPLPALPAEQVLYEDVTQSVEPPFAEQEVFELASELGEYWAALPHLRARGWRPAMARFLEQCFPEQAAQGVDLVEFSREFLLWKAARPDEFSAAESDWPVPQNACLGVVLQPWRDPATGQLRAVVNALFPGGGRLLARWLYLLPAAVRTDLEAWLGTASAPAAFPWYGWHNANFQPPLAPRGVAVPGGRIGPRPGGSTVLLGDLRVALTPDGGLELRDASGQPVPVVDLGLEDLATRPATLQVLALAGLPLVSKEALPLNVGWQKNAEGHWRFRPRTEHGRLVFHRATWVLEAAGWQSWLSVRGFEFWQMLRGAFTQMGAPRRVFWRLAGDRSPQYLDLDSPVLVLLLERALRQSPGGALWVEEMLPVPEDLPNGRATEVVVEVRGEK
jgi:hypothetical protein